MSTKRTTNKRLAQNSIDYIVYSNPKSVRKLLYDCGYEAPRNEHTLVKATKELIQKKGSEIITELLQLHPDKKAILSLNAKKPQQKTCNSCDHHNYNSKDNFCGACGHSNYKGSGDEDSFLDQFSDASDKEVQKYYDRIRKRSNTNPEDQKLASEVQLVWNELRQRKLLQKEAVKEEKTPSTTFSFLKDELVLLGVVFIAGYLVGSARGGQLLKS